MPIRNQKSCMPSLIGRIPFEKWEISYTKYCSDLPLDWTQTSYPLPPRPISPIPGGRNTHLSVSINPMKLLTVFGTIQHDPTPRTFFEPPRFVVGFLHVCTFSVRTSNRLHSFVRFVFLVHVVSELVEYDLHRKGERGTFWGINFRKVYLKISF